MLALRRRALLRFTICLPAAGCAVLAPPGQGLPDLPAPPAGPYVLGPGDTLTLRIYDQPQMSGDFSIDDSGMIDLPLLGPLPAGGRSGADLARDITAQLRARSLILNPSVTVEVAHYRPFYILGEVGTPGQYPFRPRMTVLTAVSIAGGFTDRALQDYVEVTRDTGSGPVPYRAAIFALAEPGDVITVLQRRF